MPPLLLGLFALAGPARAADGGPAFEAQVRPILTAHCVKCHGPAKQRGGLRVDSRAELLKGGDSGPAVVPGKPDESLLIKAVHHGDLKMPPAGKLSDDQIDALTSWVKGGAVWPADRPATAQGTGHAARKPGAITDADRSWWAFQPPKRPAVPAAEDGWARTPIDRFIAAGRAAAGLAPAPEADRAALVRRVTFDLTGLPPTPQEVQAFVSDLSPDAYSRLIDRLLAGPRYGERQARLWLDLVRYGESDGYRVDHARPHAWKYRDYVVRSLNADKPYDTFVREQLAGDELAPGDPDALLATGYLRLWPYEYNQRDVRGQWSAILNDITDVTADVFLGLGLACARCHDHKFDPILQKDYYSFQAFFAGLSFRDEPVFASAAERAAYEARRSAWEAKTADARAKLDGLLGPVRQREMAVAVTRFPPDIQAIFKKPAAERSPGERQLHDLAYRQVQYEHDRASSKLPKAKRGECDALKEHIESLAEQPADPTAMVARDLGPRAADTVLPGGRKQAAPVEPAFLTVLGQAVPSLKPGEATTMRRAALATWLTDPGHPLTARVMVNRVWQQHFGTGLVATASDYGTLGERPSHPELLDWLATEFVREGWSLKRLHRLIVTSAVYRQRAAGAGGAAKAKDPENRLLWRMPVRRLDAEQVRDAMLAVSGELLERAGGPSAAAGRPARSVYTRAARNDPDAVLASFDAADGLTSCARRNVTVTPTQSLLLLNGPFALNRAKAFARRVRAADAAEGVRAAFRLAYGRPPSGQEFREALTFLGPKPGQEAWSDLCHTLLNSNEFLYVD